MSARVAAPLSRPEARRLANRARNEAVDARFRFGVDSDEFRALSAIANEALDLFLATDEDDEPSDEDDWEADREIDRLDVLGLDPWGRAK